MKTIKLKGKDYVEVKERVKAFNDDFSDGSIKTELIFNSNNIVAFKATVVPDIASPERYYNGHSFGTVDEVKAFEKLETVAVGRALAFMGYGIVEGIASADEMQRFEQQQASALVLKSGVSKAGKQYYLIQRGNQSAFLDANSYEILKARHDKAELKIDDPELNQLNWKNNNYKK